MCEQYVDRIEHPNQDWWLAAGAEKLNDEKRDDLNARFSEVLQDEEERHALVQEVATHIEDATFSNHAHGHTHEMANRARIGITPLMEGTEEPSERQKYYDSLTGDPDKFGEFMRFFSAVSHEAYVEQDERHKGLTDEQIREDPNLLVHASLSLGSTRHLGLWNEARLLQACALEIPDQILAIEPDARITRYGKPPEDAAPDPRITYKEVVPVNNKLLPMHNSKDLDPAEVIYGPHSSYRYARLRRRSPFADIYIPGEDSDLVLFEERLCLLVMSMIPSKLRRKIQDMTEGEYWAGLLYESAQDARRGETLDVYPLTTHYVQGVGEKFARYRDNFTN